MFIGPEGIGVALDALGGGPVCVQWTVVKRLEKFNGAARADQEPGVYDDIATLVRASAIQARDYTLFRLGQGKDTGPLPDLHFYFPTLVVDAPLHVYDPTTRSLKAVDWMSIRITIDTHLGVTPALVDVVSASALGPMIARYKAAATAMRTLLDGAALGLAVVALSQIEAHEQREKRMLIERIGPPWGR